MLKCYRKGKNNLIRGLYDGDRVWKIDLRDIQQIALEYFKHIYSTSSPSGPDEVTTGFVPRVSQAMNDQLIAPILV